MAQKGYILLPENKENEHCTTPTPPSYDSCYISLNKLCLSDS